MGKWIRNTTVHTNDKGFRVTPDNFDKNKKSIVVFGSSEAFGNGLNDNESFPWKLSELTNRKVYNAAIDRSSTQHMLINLMSKSFYDKIENPDTFIYVYINDHMSRLYGPPFLAKNMYYPVFKLVDNQLVLVPPSPLYQMGGYAAEIANKMDFKKKIRAEKDSMGGKREGLFIAIVKESQKRIKEHYPNAKFIVINFDNDSYLAALLKNNNINYINSKDVFKEPDMQNKYFNIEYLPNASYWEKFTPLFIEKLNLNGQPVSTQPAVKQPVGKQPASKQPVNKPATNKPTANKQPAGKQSVNKQPTNKQPVKIKPVSKKK